MSGTPRTDGSEFKAKREGSPINEYVVCSDLSRKLEREVADLNKRLAAAESDAKHVRQANENYRRENEIAVAYAQAETGKRVDAELYAKCQHEKNAEIYGRLCKAEARVRELEPDARRYLWLREKIHPTLHPNGAGWGMSEVILGDSDLDDIIDQALANLDKEATQ